MRKHLFISFCFCLIIGIEHSLVFAENIWIKNPASPVLDIGLSGSWDDDGVANPCVIKDGDVYKMWYAGHENSLRIGYASSPDGITWTKSPQNPVLDLGMVGSWEDEEITEPTIIKDGGIYKMWYTGIHNEIPSIGHATSPDGINWIKYTGNPVIVSGASGSWEEGGVGEACVVKDGGTYKMWYSSYTHISTINEAIGYAISSDGINWTKYESNPVLGSGATGKWDEADVDNPTVIKQDSIYHMWYEGVNDGDDVCRIGYATSVDGLQWEKSLDNPVLDAGSSGNWDENGVAHPSVLIDENSYKMWYTSSDGVHDRIGLASLYVVHIETVTVDNPGNTGCFASDGIGHFLKLS